MTIDSTLSKRDLLALVEGARELTHEIDLGDLLEKILTRASQLTSSQSGSVLLKDEKANALFFAAATGPKAQVVLEKFGENGPDRVPIESKAGQVYEDKEGKPIVEQLITEDPRHFKGVDQEADYQTRSMICVPLRIAEHTLGVVQLLNKEKGPYTDRDIILLTHFAAHAAVAIRNAQLFRDLLAHKGLFSSSKLGQKVTDLVKELSAPAHQARMTILFADMRGFTRLAQVVGGPSQIVTQLNEFLTLLADKVIDEDGFVNKFLGDGVLAFFRGPKSEERAVRCAFAISNKFDVLKEKWQKTRNEDITFVDVGVGIVTGDVVIGSIGSGRVRDFTALGSSVNLAAAFEFNARSGKRIIVDQTTYNAVEHLIESAGDAENFEMRKADQPSGIVYKCYHLRTLRSTAVKRAAGNGMVNLEKYYSSSWAVVVGIDRFQAPDIRQLSYAVADANAVKKMLPNLGFPEENIVTLLNEQATKYAIQNAIYDRQQASDQDRLLIFFASHGEVATNQRFSEGFLLPYDADLSRLPLTALPMTELSMIGRRLPPKHILFVVDSCFSGFAAHRSVGTAGPRADLTRLTNERVVQLLAAGTSSQQALEKEGNGIFTRAFLRGIEGRADPDGGGLTALKLHNYILMEVLRDSDAAQTPQYERLDGEGEFLFAPPK